MVIQYVSIRIYVLNNGQKVVYKRSKLGIKIINFNTQNSLIFIAQKVLKTRSNLRV